MSEDKKTSLKDITDNSKKSVKKIVNNIYTKEFSYSDILLRIFIISLLAISFIYFTKKACIMHAFKRTT